MYRIRPGLAALPVVLAPLLTACAGAVSTSYVNADPPGSVEMVDGSDLGRVTLTEDAIERLGVRTSQVAESGAGLVVPSAAVFVDTEGVWWVYTSPEPRVFVRHEIAIQDEQDEQVFLSSGPAAGTEIVTVGVPELYGVEDGVDH